MNRTILLTSSIDPNGCSFLVRSDIDERKNDYARALGRWLTMTSFDFVYVDNSGYDLSFLKYMFSEHAGRVEYISYNGNGYDRGLGKGYGELDIIGYALTHSAKLSECTHLIKSTGRYFFPNAEGMLDSIRIEDYDFVGIHNNNTIHTGFFATKKDFYSSFMSNGNPVNDSAGYYIEHIFHQMCFSTEKRHLIDRLGAEGISGTFGTEISWM